MNTTITILSLDPSSRLETRPILPDGPVVRVAPVNNNRPIPMPAVLNRLFGVSAREGVAVQLVTCRRIGMPEQADGSHLQHFLVPASEQVRPTGVTI